MELIRGRFHMIKDLVSKNRTYRRFYQEEKLSMETLKELVDYARLAPTGMNQQALKYILVNTEEKNEKIFSHLKWAGYLSDWDGPKDGEKPSAYVIMLQDKTIGKNIFWDHGLASAYILLGAVEKGYGGCTIASVNKVEVKEEFKISDDYEILMVLALGKPKEEVVLYEMEPGDDIRYWRDEKMIHHVPKRKLKDIILDIE